MRMSFRKFDRTEWKGLALLAFAVVLGMCGYLTNDLIDRAFLIGTAVWPVALLIGMILGRLELFDNSHDTAP